MVVRLRRGFGRSPLEIAIDSVEQGRALLASLGLDASQTVAGFRLPSRMLTETRLRVMTVLGMSLFAGGGGVLGEMLRHAHHGKDTGLASALIMLSALLSVIVLMLTPSRLEVGADGIATNWLGRKRFIGYSDVESVSQYAAGSYRARWFGLALKLRSGEELRIPIMSGATWGTTHIAIIEERIGEALESFRRGDAAAEAALLARGERELPDWIRSLRAIGAGANAAHRTAPIQPERLWRIVEDPSADATARAGAAVALASELDDHGKKRLRAAASATASPKVRIAIEAAATADEAELAEALAALEEPRKQAS
jgi:hypothetical protein